MAPVRAPGWALAEAPVWGTATEMATEMAPERGPGSVETVWALAQHICLWSHFQCSFHPPKMIDKGRALFFTRFFGDRADQK